MNNYQLSTNNDQLPEGYKQTEVGVIPEDWEVASLGDFTSKIGSGITPTGGSRVYKDPGRPFVRSQNVGWGILNLSDLAYISEETHQSFAASEIRERDVLLNITGASIGRSSIADTKIVRGNVNQHVCIIRTNQDQLDPAFLNFLLLSDSGQRQIDSFQAGGNREGLNFGQIKSFAIRKPREIEEQRSIAQALSDVDRLIAALEKAIAKKRHIKTATMQQLLTGKKRLPGFGEGKGYKESAIGVIPEDWEVKAVGEVCDFIVPGRNKPRIFKGDIPWITTPDLEDGRGISKSKLGLFVSRYEAKSVGSRVVPTGSVLMSCVGELGIVALVEREIVINQQLHAFLPSKTVDSTFLLNVLQTQKEYMLSIATITAVPYLNKDNCNSIPIPLPQPPEQHAIATVLSDMDAAIAALETRLAKTQSIKQGMMQQLLTGKVRLKIEVSMNAGREDD